MSSSLSELQNPIKQTNSKAPSIPKSGLTYLTKEFFRQGIRFMLPFLSFYNHTLSIDGKPTRTQTRSAFRHYHKTGHCRLYIDEQYGQLADLHTKDVSKIRNLRHFSIHFRKCPNLDSVGIILMATSLGMMKGLKSIKIVFQGGESVYNDAVQRLIKAISLCKTLEKLELKFIVCPNITDLALMGLESLKRLICLKSLVFHLNWANNVTEEGIRKFEEMLSWGTLKRLEVFDLSLIATACQDEGSLEVITKIIGHLAFHKNLKVFKLNLKRWIQTDFELLAKSLEELKNLRLLDLNFEWCENFQDSDLRRICYSIRELMFLRCLSINIQECIKITDIQDIENMLYNLKELSSFSLDLSSLLDVSDNTVEMLGRGLGALISMKSLHLNLQRCWDITDEGAAKLFEGIAQNNDIEELTIQFDWQKSLGTPTFISLSDNFINLKKLKTLTLGFEWCSSITDDSVEPLSEFLAESTNLEKLSLNFANCHSLGDIAVEKLSKGLKKLVNLLALNLNFSFCEEPSNKAMESLKQTILRMPLLKSLFLNFDWSKIADEGIKELSYALQHASQLSRLFLSFSWVSDITRQALEYICQAILQLKHMSMVDFCFVCCKNITDETLREFKETLRQETKIENLYFNYEQNA